MTWRIRIACVFTTQRNRHLAFLRLHEDLVATRLAPAAATGSAAVPNASVRLQLLEARVGSSDDMWRVRIACLNNRRQLPRHIQLIEARV